MTEVLLEPYKFFARAKERPARPWLGYLVVLLASLLSGLASQLAVRNLPSPPALGSPWVWTAIGIALGSLLVWGIFGFVVHLLTGLGGRAFELVGWASAPGVLTGLALLAVAALFPVEASLPPPPADPAELGGWLRTYQATIQAAPFSQISQLLALIGTLWGAWILYAGARTFAPSRAKLVVGVYLAVMLVFLLLGVFLR